MVDRSDNTLQMISNSVAVAVNLQVGLVIFSKVNEILLYNTDYQAWVEQYLIPEQVYEANRYLKRGPMRIIIP